MNEQIEEILNFHINRKLRELNEKATSLFGVGLRAPFQGKINRSMFRAVGRWNYDLKFHTFHISGIVFDNISEEMNETIGHEFSHAYAYEQYGDDKHGKWWKFVMRSLGFDPRRTLGDDAANAINYNEKVAEYRYKVKRYIYKCECKSHKVSTTIHNRIQKGDKHNYRCVHCRGKIVYTNEMIEK